MCRPALGPAGTSGKLLGHQCVFVILSLHLSYLVESEVYRVGPMGPLGVLTVVFKEGGTQALL